MRYTYKLKELAKELCEKSGCHHKCHDTKDCVVEDEAELLISNKLRCIDCIHNEICQFYNALGTKVICYPCGFYEAKKVIANSATTTEKQIEKMAKVIKSSLDGLGCGNFNFTGEQISTMFAQALYNAGYRKQSEIVRCEDCQNSEVCPDTLLWCNELERLTSPKGFCHRGMRKGGEADV